MGIWKRGAEFRFGVRSISLATPRHEWDRTGVRQGLWNSHQNVLLWLNTGKDRECWAHAHPSHLDFHLTVKFEYLSDLYQGVPGLETHRAWKA